MSGTELIMGMEEVVQHIRELEKREENLKEALAQKFYKHYEEMDYNMLNVARTIGPDLGRMVDHLIAENKRLKEEKDDYESEIDLYTNGMSLEEWHDDMEKQKAEITDQAERDIALLEAENKKLKKEQLTEETAIQYVYENTDEYDD